MSYRSMLVHVCNVYRLHTRLVSGKYGAPDQTEYYYNDVPDFEHVPCYMSSSTSTIVQDAPNPVIVETSRFHFDKSFTPMVKDKVFCNGSELKLLMPNLIRNHHWEVMGKRDGLI